MLGLIFKETCPDLRNSKVFDMIRELESYGVKVHAHDPVADAAEAHEEYGVHLSPWEQLPKADAIIVAVGHKLMMNRPLSDYRDKVVEQGCFIDVNVWRL